MEWRRAWQYQAHNNNWSSRILLAGYALVFGLLAGLIFTAINPLYVAVGIVGVFAAMAILVSTQFGLLAIIAVLCLLPFGVIPLPLGSVKLTFLDATLSAVLIVWLARILVRQEEKLQITRVGGLVLVFVLLACSIFFMGYGATPEVMRLFLKLINSILLFFTVLNCVRDVKLLQQLVAAFVAAGAVSAALGLVLYVIPASFAAQLLSALRILGYPAGNVLRYIAGTETMRAISTSIDPNVLGGMLMLVAVLAINQLLDARPLIRRQWLVPAVAVTLLCLLLTFSRSSWLGLAAGLVVIITLRYRKPWMVLGLFVVAAILLILPPDTAFVGHLQSGLAFEDQASAMRLGEYKDALNLISQYPWFGVGFGEAPSIDLYVGVSSMYLLVAEQMGLVGLGLFLLIVCYTLFRALSTVLSAPQANEAVAVAVTERSRVLQAQIIGLSAMLVAALTAGVADHYFVNLRFPHAVAIFWLMMGLLTVAVELYRRGEE